MNLQRWVALASTVAVVAGAAPAGAHTVTLDGDASEWFAVPAPIADLGRLQCRADGGGEYFWRDALGDARVAWPARGHDLSEFRVTGDRDFLYFMAKVEGVVATTGDSVPQLQLAIDTDRLPYSGGTAFADSAGLDVAGSAAYERLVETRFGSGQAPRVLDASGVERGAGAEAVLSADGVIEVAVPWSALGFQFVPTAPVRFSAALFLTNAADVTLDPRDGTPARAADVPTQYGDPGSTGTTTDEIADGTLDYAFDLWFDARGEVVAPIVVNEAYFAGGVKEQWLEIANPTQAVVSISAFKIGDQGAPDDHEAIAQFPAGSVLVPGQAFVVARDGATFLSENGRRADAECSGSDAGTPDMAMFPAWATSTGFNIPNSGDEILVLDGANTVLDVLTFKNGSWPGIIPHPGVPLNTHSLERTNPAHDTDDCSADFTDEPVPNPGIAFVVAGVGDGAPSGGLAWSAPAPNPSRGRVSLALRLGSAGNVRVQVLDASGRRVCDLYRGQAAAGSLHLAWDGRADGGRNVAPGLYFVRADSRDESQSVRLTVIR